MRTLVRLSHIVALSAASAVTLVSAEQRPCQSARDDRLRATASYARGDLVAAIGDLRQAINSCPAEPFFKFMLANALYRAGKLEDSAASYEAFLESRPYHFEAHMSLGFTFFELGDKKKAVEQWTTAMRIEPESPFARAALAVGLYSVNDVDNALIQYERAMMVDARYSQPESLAIDIRWKSPSRAILTQVKTLISEGGK